MTEQSTSRPETVASHQQDRIKIDPEELALRAKPKPVSRINRNTLYLLTGTGLLLIFGATIFALDPPNLLDRDDTGRELYQIRNNPKADGLDHLPRRYSDIQKPKIELGPPLAGDIGPAVVQKERELGIQPETDLPFRPSPTDDAERAERIRQARLAQQARESNVFFQVAKRSAGLSLPGIKQTIVSTPSEPPDRTRNSQFPFDAANTGRDRRSTKYDLENDQNLQSRKIDFLNRRVEQAIYNPHRLQDPASPYQVMAGTIIPASLVTGINSDLPGRIIARVTENVYDTATGNHLLIPQGTRIIGTYDSVVAFGQSRALVIWQRLIMPDGSSIVIENLPATDSAGYAGLEDEVNFHTWRLIKGVVLSTLLGVGTELTFGDNESELIAALRESAQDSTNQVGQRLTQRNLNIQPTITIRPGWPLRIIVHKDLVLRPFRG